MQNYSRRAGSPRAFGVRKRDEVQGLGRVEAGADGRLVPACKGYLLRGRCQSAHSTGADTESARQTAAFLDNQHHFGGEARYFYDKISLLFLPTTHIPHINFARSDIEQTHGWTASVLGWSKSSEADL